ncbi:hydrolase, alpha beta fold family protein [Musa troglodytarum]|uniref:Hydrolase, alpha beta fold family protein n=1 Tax=Musa troglodytarum TaxID=320322 RepID=A0A9E7F988_9LILI|nr:hydrolase, alpha beta fold family protein [Musa troglodytarum]
MGVWSAISCQSRCLIRLVTSNSSLVTGVCRGFASSSATHQHSSAHGKEDGKWLAQGEVVDSAVAMGQDALLRGSHAGVPPPRLRSPGLRRRARPAPAAGPALRLQPRLSSSLLWALPGQLNTFEFRSSLIDLPIVSALRSFLILFSFLVCDGGRGLYLGITAFCSSASTAYVLIKAFTIYWVAPPRQEPRWILALAGRESPAIEALFLTSLALAIAHIAVAYRTSCRERRKLLVYRIDVEAVKIKGGLIKEDSKV